MKIWQLFKLQIDNKINIFRTRNVKAVLSSVGLGLAIILGGSLGAWYLFDYLRPIGLSFGIGMLGVIILMVMVISFFLSLGAIISNMYLSKDNELLLSLPARSIHVYISKFLVLYVYELITTALFTLPLLFAFGVISPITNFWFFVFTPLFLIFIPLIPMALASLVSIPMMMLISFLKSRAKTSIAIILILCGFAFYFYMQFVGAITDVINLTGQQAIIMLRVNAFITKVGTWPIIKLFADMFLLNGAIYLLPLLILVGTAMLTISVLIVRPFFFKMATVQSETIVKARKKPKEFKSDSAFVSLLKKETLSIFRAPDVVFQYFIFMLLMPFIVYSYDKLLLTIATGQAGQVMIMGAHILILSIMAVLTNIISASAISREGANAYLLKTAPVSFEKQAVAKITFNAIFTVGAIIVTTITTLIFSDLNPWGVIFGSLTVAVVAVGHICWCFDMDLRKPSLDWFSSSEITKLSKNTTFALSHGLLLSFASGLLIIALSQIGLWAALIVFASLACLFTYKRIRWLDLRLEKYFNEMEL